MIDPYNDEYFMQQALIEAKKAYENNEVESAEDFLKNFAKKK